MFLTFNNFKISNIKFVLHVNKNVLHVTYYIFPPPDWKSHNTIEDLFLVGNTQTNITQALMSLSTEKDLLQARNFEISFLN